MEYDIDASALSNSISQTVPLNKNQLGSIGFQNWDALNKCGLDIIKENRMCLFIYINILSPFPSSRSFPIRCSEVFLFESQLQISKTNLLLHPITNGSQRN